MHEGSVALPLIRQRLSERRGTTLGRPQRAGRTSNDPLPSPLWNVADAIRFPMALDHLAGLLVASAQGLGFDYFSYISLSDGLHSGDQVRYISNEHAEWVLQYQRDHLQFSDPVVAHCRMKWEAFAWDTENRDICADHKQEQVLARAQRFGLRCGITAPVHGPNKTLSLLTFTSKAPRSDLPELLPEVGSALLIFGVCIGSWMESRMACPGEPEQARLSLREKECLLWTARGKTSWEIAQIIGRSEDTVNFHLKRASGKLKASNKCHAVTKAITQGHLLL
jgi:LuxR family transcriptional regulator, activator of conjugal transfer of Ti plasmids